MKKQTKRILTTILICILFGFGYGLSRHISHFNRIVLEKFEGKLWELPARVYARPLELYLGMALMPSAFEQELKQMRYFQVERPVELDTPGKFLRTGNTFHVFCRAFKFEDSESSSQKIQVILQKGKVELLKNSDTSTFPDMVRLDPALIGSFFPTHHEDRVLVTLKEVPPLLLRTLLAVEDRRFYDHYGVELLSVVRATIANIRKRKVVQGQAPSPSNWQRIFFSPTRKHSNGKLTNYSWLLPWNGIMKKMRFWKLI